VLYPRRVIMRLHSEALFYRAGTDHGQELGHRSLALRRKGRVLSTDRSRQMTGVPVFGRKETKGRGEPFTDLLDEDEVKSTDVHARIRQSAKPCGTPIEVPLSPVPDARLLLFPSSFEPTHPHGCLLRNDPSPNGDPANTYRRVLRRRKAYVSPASHQRPLRSDAGSTCERLTPSVLDHCTSVAYADAHYPGS
jgi:hypothetical protein